MNPDRCLTFDPNLSYQAVQATNSLLKRVRTNDISGSYVPCFNKLERETSSNSSYNNNLNRTYTNSSFYSDSEPNFVDFTESFNKLYNNNNNFNNINNNIFNNNNSFNNINNNNFNNKLMKPIQPLELTQPLKPAEPQKPILSNEKLSDEELYYPKPKELKRY